MAKKVELKPAETEVQTDVQEVQQVQEENVAPAVKVDEKVEVKKKAKAEKVEKSKPNKPNKKNKTEKRTLGKKLKESMSELKKVSWPSFGTTVKQTGVVITVVAICTLVLFGIDRLFGWLYTLLT